MDYQQKAQEVKEELQKISLELTKEEVISNPLRLKELGIKQANLQEILKNLEKVLKIDEEIENAKNLIEESDEELKKIAQEEIEKLEKEKQALEKIIRKQFLPTDPLNNKNAILEIRAGAGGEEAALFGAELFRMYTKFAEKNGFKIATINANQTPIGGIKEIIAEIKGPGAYGMFKYESGVHRVQRIPETESSGRIHTSTATVVILPEAESSDLEINPEELKIEVFRSSGPGGQHAQKSESAVRITHLPTGLVATCQESRSQLQNKEKALMILRSKLLQKKEEEENKKRGFLRKIQIGTGERSEKIRTYNFPQNRVTDHRINFSLYNLEAILEGEIDELLEKLREADEAKKLALSKSDDH